MRSTFKLLFYINRNKVKSDGTTAVLCRISIDGKKSAVTTGIYCKPGDWDSKKCEIKTARENNRLAAFRSRLEEAYGNLLRNQGVVTAELLKTTVSGANSVPEYLLQAGEVERERLRVRSKEINSTSTYRQSKTTQLNLRQFIESRGMKDIAFSDITEEFAESFKVFLKKELGHRNGHVNHCLCWLNRLIYIAVDREVLRANPIEDVAYERKEAPKLRHISRSELKRMMETPLPDPMMELARRTFIFSSLTGLAYADTRALHPRHIGTTSEGRRYIRIRRAKTDVEAFIPLHPIAGQILDLYNTTDDDRPVFPLPVRDVLWYEVHGMGVALGMKREPVLPHGPAFVRNPDTDRGYSDREHRQDDGPYEHRQHAGLRPGHRPEDILGHGPADGKKKACGRQGSRRLNKNCRRNRKCNSGDNP